MAFEFTPEMQTISNQLWAVTSAVGAGFCLVVLVVASIVWLHPRSRPHLDRVSFRMVMYALAANTLFGTSSAIGGELTGPSWGCGFSIFVLQITLEFSSFMLYCIALNLQLVVVHGCNGRTMEKFYVIGSIAMAAALTVPTYAAGQYGWDPLEKDCWYTSDNKEKRLAWQIGTQMAWTLLTVLGEICCSLTVMIFMLRHHMRQRRNFTVVSQISSRPGCFEEKESSLSAPPQLIYANNYKNIIMRVALYPLVSCAVNLVSVVTALHSTVSNGILDQTDYNVLLLSDFLYGGRAVVYALLAASDPALIRGIKTLISHVYTTRLSNAFGTTGASITEEQSFSMPKQRRDNMTVTVELTTFHSLPAEPVTPSLNLDADVKSRNGLGLRTEGNFMDIEEVSAQVSKDFRPEDVELGELPVMDAKFGREGVRDADFHLADRAHETMDRRLRDARRREEMRKDEHEAFKRQI